MQESNGDEVTSVHNEDPGKTNKKNMQELRLKKQCRIQMEMRSLHYIMKIRRRPKKTMQKLLLEKQCRNQMEMRSLHYIMKIRGRPNKKTMQVLLLGPKRGHLRTQASGTLDRQPVCVVFPLISSFDTPLEPYSCASC